jgi:hypothetical protein
MLPPLLQKMLTLRNDQAAVTQMPPDCAAANIAMKFLRLPAYVALLSVKFPDGTLGPAPVHSPPNRDAEIRGSVLANRPPIWHY